MDNIEYNTNKVIAIANKVIKVYGWVTKKDRCTIASMLKQQSDITGKPMPYEWNGAVVDYNRAYTTAERVKDYYKNFEMTDTDQQVVEKIKDHFKIYLFKIIGETTSSFQHLTTKLLQQETVDEEYIGIVSSWPHIVNDKQKEVENA